MIVIFEGDGGKRVNHEAPPVIRRMQSLMAEAGMEDAEGMRARGSGVVR